MKLVVTLKDLIALSLLIFSLLLIFIPIVYYKIKSLFKGE